MYAHRHITPRRAHAAFKEHLEHGRRDLVRGENDDSAGAQLVEAAVDVFERLFVKATREEEGAMLIRNWDCFIITYSPLVAIC